MSTVERDPALFFDQHATDYDHTYDQPGADGHALRARMAAVLRFVGSGPGEALDAGMGPGRLLGELAARGWTVSGVDASEEMVAVARRRLPGAEFRLLRCEIDGLPFPNASFDVVVATGVLEYADLRGALSELARVVRPGGLAVVSYVNPRAFYGIWKTRVFYPVVQVVKRLAGHSARIYPRGLPLVTPAQFRELLAAVGLEPLATEHTSFLPIPSPLDMLLPGTVERVSRCLEGRGPRLGALFATQIVFSARKR